MNIELLLDPNSDQGMTEKEIVEYYHKHIDTETEWYESEDGRLFYEVKNDPNISFAQYAGSDVFMSLRPAVIEHIKKQKMEKNN